jgi:hypothetical protein
LLTQKNINKDPVERIVELERDANGQWRERVIEVNGERVRRYGKQPTFVYQEQIVPTATLVATPTPRPVICTGRVANLDVPLNVRPTPGTSFERLGLLYSGDTLDILGAAPVASEYASEITWWWYVSSAARGLTGYVRSIYVIGSNCPDPATIEPIPFEIAMQTGVCQFLLPELAEITLYQPIRGGNTRLTAGNTLSGELGITVYGRSFESRIDFLYLISDPLSHPSEWLWIKQSDVTRLGMPNVSPGDVLAQQRACDYDYLPSFYFPDANLSIDFLSAYWFYRQNFRSPIYNANPLTHFNTDLYTGRGGHNGLDIVYKPNGINTASADFPVAASWNGVVVDVGPDAFVELYKVEQVFVNLEAIQPAWIKQCAANDQLGRACRGGVYLELTRPNPNGDEVRVFVMFAVTANALGLTNEFRNDGWGGQGYGATQSELRDLLTGYIDLCGGSCNGAGRQLIILYDIDSDNEPDIQTTYLHTGNPMNALWQTECSATASGPAYLGWNNTRDNVNCQVTGGQQIGVAQNIGFSSAPHLHYTVYIDRDGDGEFPSDDDETVDPLISVHMLR